MIISEHLEILHTNLQTGFQDKLSAVVEVPASTKSKSGRMLQGESSDRTVMKAFNTIEIKINRNFDTFTSFVALELETFTFCHVTQCVSARRNRRYIQTSFQKPKYRGLTQVRVSPHGLVRSFKRYSCCNAMLPAAESTNSGILDLH